jgi:superfamily II DNA or RNA helicase
MNWNPVNFVPVAAGFDPLDVVPDPGNQLAPKLSMIPIFGFEMYAPPLIPEMENMSPEEIIELLKQTKRNGVVSKEYVKCAREIVQISVWFADHFYKTDGKKVFSVVGTKIKDLARALYKNDIDNIKKIILGIYWQTELLYVRKKAGAEQYGLSNLGLMIGEFINPQTIEWQYRNNYFIKAALKNLNTIFIDNDYLALTDETTKRYANKNLSNLHVPILHLYLKFLAPLYGVDPDKEKIGGLYGIIEERTIEIEWSLQQGDFKAKKTDIVIPSFFNPDNSTTIYGGELRQFNPDYKKAKAPPTLPSWTYKSWNELTALQKKYIRESYQNIGKMGVEANDPGLYRMQFDLKAYWKNDYPLPQFRPFLEKQWHHLLRNPDLMDGLHANGGMRDCPLILIRQARHHVWVHCYTAHMKSGIILDMSSREFPNAQAVFGREVSGEVAAEDVKHLMDKIKKENIKCLVLTETVAMSQPQMTSSSSSDEVTGTGETKKKKTRKRELQPAEEPEMEVERAVRGKTDTKKTNSETYSVANELILDGFAFDTGDFLLDSALEELAKAQSALSVLELKLGNNLSGNTWPESDLKIKLGKLPLERKEHIPILDYKLKPYQKDAVSICRDWMSHGLSGILAPDAGLGKTLVCLNMIFQEIAQNPYSESPLLVLCPKSLIHQWEKAFWKEFDQAKQYIEQKIKEIPQQAWMQKINHPVWKSGILSQKNQLVIQNHIDQLNVDFYPNLFKLLYGLGFSCGEEGRAALRKLLDGFPHDMRLVYLASLSGELVTVAENNRNLENVLFRKPRVVITTVSSLTKLKDVEQKSFSWVIIDEADRAVTGTKEKKLGEIFNAWKKPQKRLLVTATPVRNSISDVWRLLELVNGSDKNGQEFFNQLLLIKEEFMRRLLDVAKDVEVDMEEMVFLTAKLHQRVRYLRENIHPLAISVRRNDPAIRRQWNGMIPEINKRTVNIELNEKQKHLLNTTLKVNNLFTLYDNETKVKQHPDLIQPGLNKLIEQKSSAFSHLEAQARNNPAKLIEGSPMWQAMMQDLQGRVLQNQKCLIVCRHIVPQLILKEVIGSLFARYNILVDCINGDMNADMQGSALERYKSENNHAAVLLLINKSGGAGLDFPDAKVMYILGEEWNDGSREQIESRHVRVGVGGEKEIIYYHASLQHERHMRDTSMKKKLWGDLILSHPPSRETFLEDMEMMLKASIVELCAPVKDGRQLDEEQRGRLDAFSIALLAKVKEYEKEIYDAYEKCRPKEAAARPSLPKKLKVIESHPYLIEGKDNVRSIELPLRDNQDNAWRYAYMNLERTIDCTEIIQANKEKKAFSNDLMQDRLKRHEKDKFDPKRYRVVLYYPDGASQVLFETPKKTMTIRLLAIPDGTFSPLQKL